MSRWDRVKRVLHDVEGIRVEVDTTPEIWWDAGSLPVTVTLDGRGDRDQVVTQLEVKIERRNARESEEAMFLYTLPVRIIVPAGRVVVQDIQVPLILDDRPLDPGELDQVPGFMKGLVRRVAIGQADFPGPCSVSVIITYEGSRRVGNARTNALAVVRGCD